MADYNYKVELIITNETNHQNIRTETNVTEETAREILKDFHSSAGTFPFLGIDDIR